MQASITLRLIPRFIRAVVPIREREDKFLWRFGNGNRRYVNRGYLAQRPNCVHKFHPFHLDEIVERGFPADVTAFPMPDRGFPVDLEAVVAFELVLPAAGGAFKIFRTVPAQKFDGCHALCGVDLVFRYPGMKITLSANRPHQADLLYRSWLTRAVK